MSILVFTGSRNWKDRQAVTQAFQYAEQYWGIWYVVTGDQRGLDRLAYEEALTRGYGNKVVPVHAFWNEDGRGAGHKRNQQMLNVARELARGQVDGVRGFAFPMEGSVGTWNCVDDMIRWGIYYELRGTVNRRTG